MAESSSYGGYDFKPKEDCVYECPICKKIIRQFTELPCSHATCRSCLEHWEQQRSQMLRQIGERHQLGHKCTTCNQIYDLKDKQFSRAVDRIIVNRLEVLCQLHEESCQWFGTIGDYQRHSDNKCQFRSIHCRFSGCDEQFQRKHQTKHEIACNERERNCNYCENVVKHYNELHHHQNECSRFPTECPNQYCQQVLPRNEVEEHQQHECQQQEIPCTYSDIGCDVKIKRCHLEKHEKEFNTTHTKLLLKELLDTKKQLQRSTKIANETQRELKETKSKLETTTKLSQDTQRELKDTKLKLETTTKELEIAKKDIAMLETRFEQQRNEIIPLIHKSTEIISQELIKVQTQSPEKIFKSTLNTLKEPTQLTSQPPIQTKVKKYSFFEFNKLLQLQIQLQTYAEKIHLVFNEIDEGQLFHINDNECFFKLRIQQNRRKFRIHHVDDVTSDRNESTIFTNDVIVLYGSCYRLSVAIKKYNEKNCRCYVINVKECGKNHLLRYGYNDDIRWELYKNINDEVIFYFNKK